MFARTDPNSEEGILMQVHFRLEYWGISSVLDLLVMTASADSLSSLGEYPNFRLLCLEYTELSFHEAPFRRDMIASAFGGCLDWKRCLRRLHPSITSVYWSCSDECVTGVSICT